MPVRTVVERGPKNKRAVAFSLDWPGWSRSGKSPGLALETLEGGGLLGAGRHDHPDLTVGGASSGVTRRPAGHALPSQSKGSGGSASRIVIGRSVVAGLSL